MRRERERGSHTHTHTHLGIHLAATNPLVIKHCLMYHDSMKLSGVRFWLFGLRPPLPAALRKGLFYACGGESPSPVLQVSRVRGSADFMVIALRFSPRRPRRSSTILDIRDSQRTPGLAAALITPKTLYASEDLDLLQNLPWYFACCYSAKNLRRTRSKLLGGAHECCMSQRKASEYTVTYQDRRLGCGVFLQGRRVEGVIAESLYLILKRKPGEADMELQ